MSILIVNNEAKLAIRLWRTMLVLLRFDEGRYSRPMQSFVKTMPEYIIEFNASLSGVGILWCQRVNGAEVCLGGSAVSLRCLNFEGDSSYQNLCEFIGAMLGLIGLSKLGIRGVDVTMRGDSISALTWVSAERYRGVNVLNASLVFTMLCINQELIVKESVHIPGSDNGRCDALSRLWESGKTIKEVMTSIGLENSREVDLKGCQHAQTSSQVAIRPLNLMQKRISSVSGGASGRGWSTECRVGGIGRDGMKEDRKGRDEGWKEMGEGERSRDEGIGDAVIDVASLPLDVGGEQVLSVTLSLHSVLKQVTQDLRPRVRLH